MPSKPARNFHPLLVLLGILLFVSYVKSMSKNRRWRKPKTSNPKPKPHQAPAQQNPAGILEEPKSGAVGTTQGVPSDTDNSATKCETKPTYDGAKLLVEVLTLAAVIVYAWYAYWQAHYSGQLVTISQDQQRPYLWAVPVPKKPGDDIFHYFTDKVLDTNTNPPEKQPIEVRVNIYVKNSGHSPAIDVIASPPFVGYWPTKLFSWTHIKSEYPPYPPVSEGSIIGPDSFMTIENAFGQTKTNLSSVLFAQGGNLDVFFIVGSVKYSDLWHKGKFPYETTYCYILLPAPYLLPQLSANSTDRVENCPFGNHFQ